MSTSVVANVARVAAARGSGRVSECRRGTESGPAFRAAPSRRASTRCRAAAEPDWKTKEGYATPPERLDKLTEIFGRIEQWTMTKTKFEVMDICNPLNIPVGPILSMKEIAEDEGLRATGTIVEVDHPERGAYLSVGCPIKLSDSPVDVERSPLLGEHTEEILTKVLGYEGEELERIKASGAVGEAKAAAE